MKADEFLEQKYIGFDLEEVVYEVINENPAAVEDFNSGQVMQKTNGRANGGETRKKLMEELQ